MRALKRNCSKKKYAVPIIADIHFSATLASDAAKVVEKVRINPGNFHKAQADVSKQFELQHIRSKLFPLIDVCKQYETSIRIGTNHGSLSPRIKSEYGSGYQALAASTMEFVRLVSEKDFHNVILSVKASNTIENIKATQLLCEQLQNEQYSFPLHLGVTEAGLGFSGRIKSAVGIGALLADGFGDTIRVSLTEAPEKEIPVARQIANLFAPTIDDCLFSFTFRKQFTTRKKHIYNNVFSKTEKPFYVIGDLNKNYAQGFEPDICFEDFSNQAFVVHDSDQLKTIQEANTNIILVKTQGARSLYDYRTLVSKIAKLKKDCFFIWSPYIDADISDDLMRFAASFGSLLNDSAVDACYPRTGQDAHNQVMQVLFEVLQCCGVRNTHAEFISCPSCNRSSFDILQLAEEVRSNTHHFKGLSIAVMGCIVNGPGEMGAVDYGLVGHGHNTLALYHKGVIVEKNISIDKACEKLLSYIDVVENMKE